MYKAGYDPDAMLRFFEKLQAKEKSKQATVSSMFSDHPPTTARIAAVKKEIETILPERSGRIVTTSEFDQVKARLTSLDTRPNARDQQRPSIRRGRQGGRQPDQSPTIDNPPDQGQPEDDGPPTIKRKS